MPKQEVTESTADRIKALYPDYMYMIRAFVSEGIIEVAGPTDRQKTWAHHAALGNTGLERVFSQLAQLSEVAYKQRFLEGMPMLIDLETPLDQPAHNGFESVERFHFLRLLASDYRSFADIKLATNLSDVHPVLFYIEE